jgi:GTP diphosphokinase / guanosine-3',5'-bis(diphosphate) 3'-diphosphatase
MIRINDIIDKITAFNPGTDLDLVERAYVYSARVHDGQVRLSGEPYLSHPLEVAGILADMKLDVVSIAAGLLHDVIEDTHASAEDLREMFGEDITRIVSGVTKLSRLPFDNSQAREAESIRKMFLAMADDIRVILIKLADRLHNIRTLQFHKEDKRRKIARETMDIYAPLASRLGIFWIKNELENTSFMYLQPEEYNRIKGLVSKEREEREKYVQKVKELLEKKMVENNLRCEVLGRFKHYYSIYHKMVVQDLAFEEVYDVIAFRIILDTISQCYEALGLVHAMWKPIGKKFKDYIGMPKANMYQSLHTTVIGPFGERIEIQIRTREMDQVAKSGIAAHWSYKEGKNVDENLRKTFAWIQNLVENQEAFKDPNEFFENLRIDLFPDEVYVFTPKGEIKALPRGATPVDFAYAIHTEVGNQCTGAKVNGRMVPLHHELNTGNIVEIITTKNHKPSKDWLNFTKTVKARSRIRQWIKTQERDRSISLGREMCEKAFRKHRHNFNALFKSDKMQEVVEEFGFRTPEDLIANIGYGKITPLQILTRFMPKEDTAADPQEIVTAKSSAQAKKRKMKTGVIVKGVDDILIRFGRCCHPVPGDPITGYITRGYGVTVHRASCINALKMTPERQIEVDWSENIQEKEMYPASIRVRSHDRSGLLADIAATISKMGPNILSAHTETLANKMVDGFFTITVENTEQLNKTISALKKVKLVLAVERIDN